MTLNQLEYFLKVVECGTISKAAKELFLSQPALSQQIKALEDELGCKLFNRMGKHLNLTEAGVILKESAKSALSNLNSGKEKLTFLKQGSSGTLSIGVSRSSSIEYLPHWLNSFSRVHSRVKYFIHNGEVEELISDMLKNTIDIVFTRNLPKDQDILKHLIIRNIKNDRILAVCPKDSFPEATSKISLRDFDGKRLILRHNLEKNLQERCLPLGAKPIIHCLCDDVVTSLMMVNQCMGYSIVPESCRYLVNMLNLELYEIEELTVSKHCYVVYPQEELNPLTQKLLKIIIEDALPI